MPQPAGPRKPPGIGLWGPFAVAGFIVLAWSLAWWLAAREVERRLDAGVRTLAASGVSVEWSGRRLYGYPFRLNLDLSDLRVRAGDWAVRLPVLETQAFLHAPRSWLAAAPPSELSRLRRDEDRWVYPSLSSHDRSVSSERFFFDQ